MSVFRNRYCDPADHRYQLYQQLMTSSLDEQAIMDLVKSHPKLCSIKYEFPHAYYPLKKRKMTVYPLSRIVCLRPSLKLVELVYKLHPEAIRERDESGLCPLQYACRLLAPKEVVRFLINKYPEAVGVRAREGEYALHLACGSFQPLEIIQELVQHGKGEFVRAVSLHEVWTPLHFATRHKSAPGVIPYLLELYPEAAKSCGNHGRLPLHHACWSRKPLSDIEALVSVFPDAVMCSNDQKRLPLHIACQRQNSIDVIQYLVNCFPEAVKYQSLDGKTPIDYAMEERASNVAILFLEMVEKDLDAIVKLPAAERQTSLDTILQAALCDKAKARPARKRDSMEPKGDDNLDSGSSIFDHEADWQLSQNVVKPETVEPDHLESVEDNVVIDNVMEESEQESQEQTTRTTRPASTTSTSSPGAMWVRGPGVSVTSDESYNEYLCDTSEESTEEIHNSSRTTNTVVTRTPIAAEISPRVAELEAQLEEYRRRLDSDIVEADQVLPPITENQTVTTTATCCVIL